ncbi:MAG: DNA polymerase III subunit alpha [Bacteroidota bacterium]
MPNFVHLHNHTEFSLLDGAAKIKDMVKKAAGCGMSHVAITDHGNMYGVPKFVLAARKNNVQPIVGCEFYIISGDAREKNRDDKRYHQILWAKDKEGYQNLVKLCSFGYTDGYYYKPRIDKEVLELHSNGLIASTCCLAGEINQTYLNRGDKAAEEMLFSYLDLFGRENYYIEVQRHTLGDMERCNEWLLKMAKKHDLTVIATNDVHYVNEEDSEAHDLLLALQTQSDYTDPNRFRFTDDKNRLNPRFFFKTQEEMAETFPDLPEALDNTLELAERCSFDMNLAGDMILPQYQVPEGFKDMDDYLAALTWERAPKRYPNMTAEIRERIEHELKIMKNMGYAGYFLIVQSFTTVARERGVYVGPGRGSAAGSVVAYILGIIDIDPLTYDLLFERFLNPERVSPPDIDIDFDDEGRQEVIDFVVNEYGRKSVSQVITYGTMGAKTALRDVGRTLGIPLAEVNRIAKLIPEKPGMSFKKALNSEINPDGAGELTQLFQSRDPLINRMMRYAKTLEGTARHTGVHACAVIIAPGDITNYAPVSVGRDNTVLTQYDGPMAEMCGLLKMDFLGLKTLSILKTSIQLVKENRDIEVDPDAISLEDEKTYALYQRGDTVATFQFESDGMRKYLRMLKPTNIEDLIAMNALYRPGPMDNIPSFINRKHGREPLVYPHEMLEPILKNTYGIMVYQEQIMQVARTMGGYTMGGADLLRRAMGKKKMEIMAKEKVNFLAGAKEREVGEKTADEVWALMEKFASYGFNKCLTGNTEILDADSGRLIKIKDLYTGESKVKYTPTLKTDTLALKIGKISQVMDNGIKPTFRLRTASGKQIEATDNHPFFTLTGWKNLGDLQVGAFIATPSYIPVEGKKEWPKLVVEEAAMALHEFYQAYEDCEIDPEIFSLKNSQIELFLARFLEGNLFISEEGQSIRLNLLSERLAHQLQHLLLRLRIQTQLLPKGMRRGRFEPQHQLRIKGEKNLLSFVKHIGKHFSRKKAFYTWVGKQLAGKQRGLRSQSHRLNKGNEVGTQNLLHPIHDQTAYRMHSGDVYWDRVVAIDYVGEQQTYDLEVPGTHNFLANDIVVHNSHAAAYSVLAFKTAYMKAHYPAEYMASVLTHNVNDIKKITFFIEECRRMDISVLPPDINESQSLFSVNPEGQIRFGLEAIKGVGQAVVEELIKQRKEEGPFESLFDLTRRMPPRSLNKKTLESLVYAGALDCFPGIQRFQYFLSANGKDDTPVLERAIQYGTKYQMEQLSPQISLFGGADGQAQELQEPPIPMGTMRDGEVLESWTRLEELNYEKEVIGFYLSGHPLERFKWQIDAFTTCTLADLETRKGQEVILAGIVTTARERIAKRSGNKFLTFTIEDFSDSLELALFGDQYANFRHFIRPDERILIKGRYQARRYDDSEFELRINEIQLMTDEVFDKMIKHLCLELSNETLNDSLLQRIHDLCTQYEGSKPLHFTITDVAYNAQIPLICNDIRIQPTGEFIEELGELGVGWKVG